MNRHTFIPFVLPKALDVSGSIGTALSGRDHRNERRQALFLPLRSRRGIEGEVGVGRGATVAVARHTSRVSPPFALPKALDVSGSLSKDEGVVGTVPLSTGRCA